MATFRKADPDVFALVAKTLKDTYPELKELGVTVQCLFAYPPTNPSTGEPTGPALRHHGYPAAAVIKVTSHADRVAGLADAVLKVDADWWKGASDESKAALIDHEICHLEVATDDEGNPKYDDAMRPKLRSRPHDHEVGLFAAVVSRHGAKAVEAVGLFKAYQAIKEYVQGEFHWG